MLVTKSSRTAELVAEARQACRAAHEAVTNLNQVKLEIAETMSHLRWWRFLDYDIRTLEFIEKLDTKPETGSVDHT